MVGWDRNRVEGSRRAGRIRRGNYRRGLGVPVWNRMDTPLKDRNLDDVQDRRKRRMDVVDCAAGSVGPYGATMAFRRASAIVAGNRGAYI